MPKIAVIGATGFLGRAVVARLARDGDSVLALSREGVKIAGALTGRATGDLEVCCLEDMLSGADAVINCAARVHVTKKESASSESELNYRLNTILPLRIASACLNLGVGRFVQISSVAAISSSTSNLEVANDFTGGRPTTSYGRSKYEADEKLTILHSDAFHPVSLRPPMIFGPGVGAHFARLMRLARLGVPLPLPTQNKRSFIFIENLAGAISAAVRLRTRGSFIVTDSQPISSAMLYNNLCDAYENRGRAIPCPQKLSRLLYYPFLRERADSLVGSAAFSGSRFSQFHGWQPSISFDDGINKTVTAT